MNQTDFTTDHSTDEETTTQMANVPAIAEVRATEETDAKNKAIEHKIREIQAARQIILSVHKRSKQAVPIAGCGLIITMYAMMFGGMIALMASSILPLLIAGILPASFIAIGVYETKNQRKKYPPAVETFSATNDLQDVGLLLDILSSSSRNHRTRILAALERLLPWLTDVDVDILSKGQQMRLVGVIMNTYYNSVESRLPLAIVSCQALSRIGNAAGLTHMNQILKRKPVNAMQDQLHAVVNDSVSYWQDRLKHLTPEYVLLRASSANTSPTNILLRASDQSQSLEPASELLRADVQHDRGTISKSFDERVEPE